MTNRNQADHDIVVIGTGCLLPGATNRFQLWAALQAQQSVLKPATSCVDKGVQTHWRFGALPDTQTVGINPQQEPIKQWLQFCMQQALAEAGIVGQQQLALGAVVGNLGFPTQAMCHTVAGYWLDAIGQWPLSWPIDAAERFMAYEPLHQAMRSMGFATAPSYALDAACASGLYAIDAAMTHLRQGDAQLMFAGGINASWDHFLLQGFDALTALSPSGQSRPFHPHADGLVPSHGCALVLLARLEDARSLGWPIRAVIRGVGLSNDGAASGLLLPSSSGQVKALQAAYRAAELSPDDIDYLECHATGTLAGDAVERSTINAVFNRSEALHLSAIKSVIGHTITASATAALINIIHAFEQQQKPPSINDLGGDRAWPVRAGCVRRAAVNAFGFGGNNAHLVCEAWDPHASVREKPPRRRQSHRCAVIAMTAQVGQRVEQHWQPRWAQTELPLLGSKLPPHDAALTLAQQCAVFSQVDQLLTHIPPCPQTTSVFVGMEVDANIARYYLRWMIGHYCPHWSVEQQAQWMQAVIGPLTAPAVLGCMPNIIANRLNHQYHWQGPSHVFSEGRQSGIRAMKAAISAITQGVVSHAVVAAVDLTTELATALALQATGQASQAIDMVATMVLVCEQQAADLGVPVLATVECEGETCIVNGQRWVADAASDYRGGYAAGDFVQLIRALEASGAVSVSGSFAQRATRHYPAHWSAPWCRTEHATEPAVVAGQSLHANTTALCAVGGDSPPMSANPLTEPATFPGPQFSRQDLEAMATGPLAPWYGAWFQAMDAYERVIRMPEPPLLLADRVLGIEGEAGSMGLGRIWTETDVAANSWYVQAGQMPPGIMIEAGQADLLLISWLGMDQVNRGERVYRLLGAELIFYGSLPVPGDTIRYEITIDDHAKHGDVRLFFFHSDATIDGQRRMSVRHGQAGFFTEQELQQTAGVLWDPQAMRVDDTKPHHPWPLSRPACRLTSSQLDQLAQGQCAAVFPDLILTQTHTRTPTIHRGRQCCFTSVPQLDLSGGPLGRGYCLAEQRISPDDWFFQGHFKNDPCMPGTLMLDVALQALTLIMIAAGITQTRDAWVFELLPETVYRLRCRGQVTPTSQKVQYEIFVTRFEQGDRPTVWAEILGSVDGVKAFHTNAALRLSPAWIDQADTECLLDQQTPPSRDGFLFDRKSLLACANGKPSLAFGQSYQVFDNHRRVARLPSPPYHFISSIIAVVPGSAAQGVGTRLQTRYCPAADVWYARENPSGWMPVCVLMEVALQPCGWLASYLDCALMIDDDLLFRNLDGEATHHVPWRPDGVSAIETEVICTKISCAGGMILIGFDVTCAVNGQRIWSMKTGFGFFPAAAFAQQKGLAKPEWEGELRLQACDQPVVDLTESGAQYALLPEGRLLMIDRITGRWYDQAAHCLRGEKQVDPDDWYFKAHFFQDPVQPGSLGIEALVQMVQFYLLDQGYAQSLDRPYFEPVATESACVWSYRGQVTPCDGLIQYCVVIKHLEQNDQQCLAQASGTLWVDGKRIYELRDVTVRLLSGGSDEG